MFAGFPFSLGEKVGMRARPVVIGFNAVLAVSGKNRNFPEFRFVRASF
jgi:hypothetical protein